MKKSIVILKSSSDLTKNIAVNNNEFHIIERSIFEKRTIKSSFHNVYENIIKYCGQYL